MRAILFDFDGTLADTAPDLAGAANDMRQARGLALVDYGMLRPQASLGARGLISAAFNITPQDAQYEALREEFLQRYEARLTQQSVLFAGVTSMLERIEAGALPWGIVTNKAKRYAQPLVQAFGLQPQTLVCGDTTAYTKPHPEPLLHAARQLGCAAQDCVYVGDDLRDVQAGQAAGMQTWVALWGYLGQTLAPGQWGATRLIAAPHEILAA
jgi:N-acetyl-D-muramate 6-phosphate phosphatase